VAAAGVTVAVKVTGCPYRAGLGEAERVTEDDAVAAGRAVDRVSVAAIAIERQVGITIKL
jgi:hypothetical protein